MAAIYKQRHPESTVLYPVLAAHFDSFLISPEAKEKILSWRHTGFNVHSKVRTTTTEDARIPLSVPRQ